MYQQITLVGNLGQDPEMRYTPSGVPVTSFSLAVNKSWVNTEGQRQDKTLWFRVTAWRKLAETASQYLTKGRQILVIGEIEEARPWTDRDGNLRASLEVTAQTIKFLNTRADGAPGAEATGGFGQSANHAEAQEVRDEDIPF
jgi:single-strand DNA-binding protein